MSLSEPERDFTENPQTCETCRRVGLAVQSYQTTAKDRKKFKYIDQCYDTGLGTFQEILTRTACSACCLIVQCAKDCDFHWKSTSKLRLKSNVADCFYIENDAPPFSSFAFLPLDRRPRLPHGLRLDHQWIDTSRVMNWIENCRRHHSNQCGNLAQSLRLELPSDMMLIDLRRKCLVAAKENDKYYALSYVWGQCSTVKTLTSNLGTFQQEGAISVDNEAIPATIRDAMRLVMLLGESYLWVDALCIVQDDERLKYTQLKAMPSIYANASVTIVAAQGKDANHGLRGIPNGTGPRDLQQLEFEFLPGSRMIEHKEVSANGSTWQNRAWTFQEDRFSARKLVFTNNTVKWECVCADWEEGMVNHNEIRLQTGHTHQIQPIGPRRVMPKSDYKRNVQQYNYRDLTYDKDILDAHAGISLILNESLGALYFEMPRRYFHDALLWEPVLPLRRRQVRVETHGHQSSENVTGSSNLADHGHYNALPSWSWVGWHGAIRALSSSSSRRMSGKCWETDITSGVKWYIIGATGQLELLVDSQYTNQPITNTLDASGELPHDQRHLEKAEAARNTVSPSAISGSTWRLPRVSISDSKLQEVVEKSPFATLGPFLTPFLVCHTARTFFFLRGPYRPVNGGFSDKDCLSAYLIDCRGLVGGKVFLNTNNAADAPLGTTCELIAISTSLTPTKRRKPIPCHICRDEDDSKSTDQKDVEGEDEEEKEQFIEVCNVLWIEWVDGIAYRKAPGQVVKELWDEQPIEWIDVTLG